MPKIVGDGQLSDLGVQGPYGFLVDRRFLHPAVLEDVRRPLEQSLLPLVDHRRMHAVFRG